VSPVKHDLPPSSPPLPSSSAGLGLGQANVAGSFRVSDGNGNLGELAGARRSVSASEAPAKELVGANPALEGNKPVLQASPQALPVPPMPMPQPPVVPDMPPTPTPGTAAPVIERNGGDVEAK